MSRRLYFALLLLCLFLCLTIKGNLGFSQIQLINNELSGFYTSGQRNVPLQPVTKPQMAGVAKSTAVTLASPVPVVQPIAYKAPVLATESLPSSKVRKVNRYNMAPRTGTMQLDETLEAIIKRHKIPGLSIAITKNEQLVFSKGYGYANLETGELVSQQSLFRIASLSKPITSAAILKLVQEEKIFLSDKVFGPEGILHSEFPIAPLDSAVHEITVYHLLTHSSGWTNNPSDPMLVGDLKLTAHEIIANQIRNKALEFAPGTTSYYSNLGYSILGRVIEKVSGMSYLDYVREEIMLPAGMLDIQMAGSYLQPQAFNEVTYYQKEYNPYAYNMERMDAHGGWLSTAEDMIRFMSLVDRNSANPGIINSNLLEVTYFGSSTWSHYGSLPGTTAVMTRLNDEYSFVVLANTRNNRAPQQIADELNHLLKEKLLQITDWPKLVQEPQLLAEGR